MEQTMILVESSLDIHMSKERKLLDEHDLDSFRVSGVKEMITLLRKGKLHRASIGSYLVQ